MRNFPGPRGHIVAGSLFDAWNDPLEMFVAGVRDHGDLVKFRFGWLDYFLVNDAAGAHRILVENAKAYHKSPNYNGMKVMLGEGLLTSEGDFWKRQRKLTQPAFHRDCLKGFADTMVETTADLVTRWKKELLPGSKPFDLHVELMRLTFRIVGKTLLGADLEADAKEFGKALNFGLEWANDYVESIVRIPPWVPTPKNLKFKKAQGVIEGVIGRVVQERRASKESKQDLLGLLMGTVAEDGERMSDKQLMDELLTLTLAGHETTSNALAFTLYLLSSHPDVARRVRAEIQSVLGDRAPSLEDLPNMPLVRAVIDESMRLYPPAWVFERITLEDEVVLDHRIPKGSIVAVSPYLMHRNPRWFPNPEGFDPDRFLTPDPARPKLQYIPFGGGPRTCIGNAFALTEMQLVLPMLLQSFDLHLAPGFRLGLEPSVTLRPRGGIWMRMLPRDSSARPANRGQVVATA